MWEFITSRWVDIAFRSYQHVSLVLQAVLLALLIAVLIAIAVLRIPRLQGLANAFSAIGLTLPSFALLGLLLPFMGVGPLPAFTVVAFYACLPILRNAVVGLQGVDPVLVESAAGMGMSRWRCLLSVQLPLAWPVILAGVRTSAQMSMGIAAVAAYTLGPGLGAYIFTGLASIGGKNALNYAVTGTVGVVLLALLVDLLFILIGRLTISRGIRA